MHAVNHSIGSNLSDTFPDLCLILVIIPRVIKKLFLTVVCLVPFAASGQPAAQPVRVLPLADLAPPIGRSSGQPFLQRTPDHHLLISWMETGNEQRNALRFARYGAKGWTPPHLVIEEDDFFVNWADVPSVIQLSNETIAAHWLQKNGKGTYAYDVRLQFQRGGTKSWSGGKTPHRDGTQTEHGFVSLIESPLEGVEAVWLDGRAMAGSGGHAPHGDEGSMALRTAVMLPDGSIHDENELDPRVCECCPTAAVRTETGILVAYRDRSETEMRDIAVIRKEHGKWGKPSPVHQDGWQIPGCPVNGPALASAGNRVVVAWFTAPGGEAKVLVAFSENNGASFGPPVRVDAGQPLGRVDVEALSDGTALVSWIEWHEDGTEWLVRRVAPQGPVDNGSTITPISAERASGYPRMVVVGEDVFFAWVEVEGKRGVRVASIPLAALIGPQK